MPFLSCTIRAKIQSDTFQVKMIRFTCIFVWALFFVVFNRTCVLSSPSQNVKQSSSRTIQQSLNSAILTISGGSNNTSTPRQRSSSKSTVIFLYELHEHEIYNPQTSSWTSRRFTQSPITGGGGRDSTSLDPASCSPPRNYAWDGEWKIDMAGEMRDGFGWEYYVGRFDGLGRRRRRWVRNLRRIGEQSVPQIQKANTTKASLVVEDKKVSPTLLRAIMDQYSFKGFGWSFNKSLIWKRSFGATFRVPLSSNFAFFDRYAAIPFASWTTYFGYPWVVATFLNASVPLEVLEWVIGGCLWKIKWAFAVISALVRSMIEATVWIAMTPWRTWLTMRQIMLNVAKKKSRTGMAQSLIDSIDAEEDGDDTRKKPLKDNSEEVKIDGLIELSSVSSGPNKEMKDMPPVSTNAVVSSPRGGASSTTSNKKSFRTILGHKVPTFHRTTNIEYSSTISQRVGVCISWRVSKERGYEYRWNFWCSFLPTQECWEHLDKIAKQRMSAFRSKKSVDGYESAVSTSKLKSFLYDHSATLGFSSGYPLPVDPYFSLSLLLSLSGFYYGWLLKSLASLLCLQRQKDSLDGKEKESSIGIETDTKLSATRKKSSAASSNVNTESESEEEDN